MVEPGVTMIEVPFPAFVPPHETVYHCHVAPVPDVPPVKDNVDDAPGQTEVGDAFTDDAAVDVVFNVTVVLTQVVFPQVPSALT